jgi:hypothetical protein
MTAPEMPPAVESDPAPTGAVARRGDADAAPAGQGSMRKQITGSDNPRFANGLLNAVANTAWVPPNAAPEDRERRVGAALAAMTAFGPGDAVEGMMAAQAVALHHGAMECLRRAMLADLDEAAADRLRRQGANLARAMVEMTEALERRRGNGVRQVVRVEKVVVREGGQAVVGVVAAGKSDRTRGEG